MLQFAALGALASMLFIFLSPDLYWFGGLLAIISNVSFGASYVFFHAFIPLLTRNHPDVLKVQKENPNDSRAIQEITEKTGNKISTHGISIGFLGGVVLLMICAGIAYAMDGTDFSLQIGICLI
jgi:UMF1 family MFS transporter